MSADPTTDARTSGDAPSPEALPRMSVVICNYNYGAFVGDAIRSALDQDYPPDRIEVVVVDDGSTDDSRTVYAAFAHEARVRVLLQENRGQTAAVAAGVAAASGDYVCLLDSDDLFLPCKLRRLAEHLAQLHANPDTLFLCHDLHIDDITGAQPERLQQTWFSLVGVTRLPDTFTLAHAPLQFPFSIPAGMVLGRPLADQCLRAIPAFEFRTGVDGILCPTALFKVGRVHYLREQLSVYRVHSSNEFASLEGGRYKPRFDPTVRTPKTLRFLELWIDALDQPQAERGAALGYFRRLEHLGRKLSASRALPEPAVHLATLGAGEGEARELFQSRGTLRSSVVPRAGRTPLAQLAAAYADGDAEYLAFRWPGDEPDREFVERQIYLRQNGPLVAVSCCDVRLVSPQGSLVHADVFRNSGAWKQPLQQVPPLATGLRDWVAPPMAACLFRRTAFLDRLFASIDDVPAELQASGFWLVFQLAHHTGGALRILETLVSCRLPDGAAASYAWLGAPSGPDGALVDPPIALAADWLGRFYQREQALFRRWLPPAWHQRFGPWLAAQRGR